MFEEGKLDGVIDPAELVTLAMRREMRQYDQGKPNALLTAERQHHYPEVAVLGRVINTDTRLVVVDASLRDRIADRDKLSIRDVLEGSVQIWSDKIDSLLTNKDFNGRVVRLDEIFPKDQTGIV